MPRRHAPVHAVIGAGYGDEGKGLLVDALCARLGPDTVVVRHNGGAQAGHTVQLPDGRRHVFHHVGAGSFAGARTHLSRFFVSNPILLGPELAELARLGVVPRVTADERGALSTPYDMLLNRLAEEARGDGRHGSCGIGFGETIERNLHPSYALTLADLRGDLDDLARRLDRIRREWVPRRLTRLGLPDLYLRGRDAILSDDLLARFLGECAAFLASVDLVRDLDEAAGPDAPLVFEGAQGLGLDQDYGAFPHVTRSRTGLANAAALARELSRPPDRLEAVYATRAYVTRHGAGPLAHALPGAPWAGVVDETNLPNAWQGGLRFGLLDLDVLAGAVRRDVADATAALKVAHRLAVTCLDQIGGHATWMEGREARKGGASDLAAAAGAAVGGEAPPLESRGPTRATLDGLSLAPARSAGAGAARRKAA